MRIIGKREDSETKVRNREGCLVSTAAALSLIILIGFRYLTESWETKSQASRVNG